MRVRLPYPEPMDVGATLAYLGARAIPGVERVTGSSYARTLSLPGGPARVEVTAAAGALHAELSAASEADAELAIGVLRQLFDLDADVRGVDEALGRDAHLAPLVAARPGLRSPGAIDGFELLIRAIVGQQVSVAGARTVLGRISATFGKPAFDDAEDRLFPTPSALAGAHELPMPARRAETIRQVARLVDEGALRLDAAAEPAQARARMLSVPGIGEWTADYVAMRALGDRDVLMHHDLGVRRTVTELGIPLTGRRPDWAPWRTYVTHHLWAAHSRAPSGPTERPR
ncbi:MAG: hypothetical protein JO147_09835 [Actinobacteria bacterium]|nr:hypothetical protein [Actinomycetota bacterium]